MNFMDLSLVYGYYPEVVSTPGDERAILSELVDSYLYKDILALDSIKKSDHIVGSGRPIRNRRSVI